MRKGRFCKSAESAFSRYKTIGLMTDWERYPACIADRLGMMLYDLAPCYLHAVLLTYVTRLNLGLHRGLRLASDHEQLSAIS